MNKSLIFIDNDYHKCSIDLLEVVRLMYNEPYETYGICINHKGSDFNHVFDKLIKINRDDIEHDAKIMSDIMAEIHELQQFDTIIIPATTFGRMLAPRLAMRLNVGLVADVTSIVNEQGVLEMVRPAFSGKIMAGIVQIGNGPTMMSVRPNVFTYAEQLNNHTEIINFEPTSQLKSSIKLLNSDQKTQSYDIRDSNVLISGGGGIIKDFGKIEQLATKLGGQVSASRKIIDKGIAPRSIQVGQSGKTVTPKLYIALGINGAIQHVEGLKNVECIISVNTNKDAPICSLSDMVVEGDAHEFIEKLTEKIRQNNF